MGQFSTHSLCVGKQIAAVKKSGCITQFKPDLKEIVDFKK